MCTCDWSVQPHKCTSARNSEQWSTITSLTRLYSMHYEDYFLPIVFWFFEMNFSSLLLGGKGECFKLKQNEGKGSTGMGSIDRRLVNKFCLTFSLYRSRTENCTTVFPCASEEGLHSSTHWPHAHGGYLDPDSPLLVSKSILVPAFLCWLLGFLKQSHPSWARR